MLKSKNGWRLHVVFGGSLQVTAPPLEQTQVPHGVAVTSSQHQKAHRWRQTAASPVLLQVLGSHIQFPQGDLVLVWKYTWDETRERKRRNRARESTEVNSRFGLGGSGFSTWGVSTRERLWPGNFLLPVLLPEESASLLTLFQRHGQRAKAYVDNTDFMVAVNIRAFFSICEYMGVSDLCTCRPHISCLLWHLSS